MISGQLDTGKIVQEAADEIDSRLGFVYKLPLTPLPPAGALPEHEVLLLKQINNKLASGRLIMQIAAAGEDRSLHAYGLRLVTEATNDLMLLANGTVELTAVKQPISGSVPDKTPMIFNHDEESAVDMFESAAMRRGEGARWQPGKVASENPNYQDPVYVDPVTGQVYWQRTRGG